VIGYPSDLSWDEEMLLKPWEHKPDLPEDIYTLFTRKAPIVKELMDRYDLDIEL
jgi:hypothetical protein